jgi:hypothetical protein
MTSERFVLPYLAAVSLALAPARSARADETATPPVQGGPGRGEDTTTRPPVVIWPTLTPAGDSPAATALHKPQSNSDKDVYERALELDATLRDAVQDLGFTLYVAESGPTAGRMRDEDLIGRAAGSPGGGTQESGTWVVSPRIESAGGGEFVIRIVVVPPNGRELRVRVETVPADSVGVRGLVMVRDMLAPTTAAQAAVEQEREQAARGTAQGITSPLRSQGRAVLAANAGLFGGFSAFSVQRASGSTDPRVLYPLLALGTGVGIGGALLVADEWDLTSGDAWVLSAGAWWGVASALLITAGRNVQPFDDRYSWGVGGGLIGTALATLAITRTPMDDGDATLVHSGAALGLLLGGTGELLYRGATLSETSPSSGMGYGTAIGLVLAGALATQVTVSPSRVLLVDLGVGGGALIGAAIGSPLIFENATRANTRGWLATTLGGSVGGGLAAWWFTRDFGAVRVKGAWVPGAPSAGIVGSTATPRGEIPAYGVTWGGPW